MIKELPPERMDILKKYGFGDVPDCDISYAFNAPRYALETPMLVQGDHATDYSHIFYARTPTDQGELEGLFYTPSLLEYMLYDYGAEWNPDRMLKEINKQTDNEIRLVAVHGYPTFFIGLDDYDWTFDGIRYAISDMYKLIGQLDYLLPRKWKQLRNKRRKENL